MREEGTLVSLRCPHGRRRCWVINITPPPQKKLIPSSLHPKYLTIFLIYFCSVMPLKWNFLSQDGVSLFFFQSQRSNYQIKNFTQELLVAFLAIKCMLKVYYGVPFKNVYIAIHVSIGLSWLLTRQTNKNVFQKFHLKDITQMEAELTSEFNVCPFNINMWLLSRILLILLPEAYPLLNWRLI